MILRLAHAQPANLAVVRNEPILGVFFLQSSPTQQRAVEVNNQLVRVGPSQHVGDVDTMGEEHVVAFENRDAVQLDMGECVESVEHEID